MKYSLKVQSERWPAFRLKKSVKLVGYMLATRSAIYNMACVCVVAYGVLYVSGGGDIIWPMACGGVCVVALEADIAFVLVTVCSIDDTRAYAGEASAR